MRLKLICLAVLVVVAALVIRERSLDGQQRELETPAPFFKAKFKIGAEGRPHFADPATEQDEPATRPSTRPSTPLAAPAPPDGR